MTAVKEMYEFPVQMTNPFFFVLCNISVDSGSTFTYVSHMIVKIPVSFSFFPPMIEREKEVEIWLDREFFTP